MPVSIALTKDMPSLFPDWNEKVHIAFIKYSHTTEDMDESEFCFAYKENLKDRYWVMYESKVIGMVFIEKVAPGHTHISFFKDKKF